MTICPYCNREMDEITETCEFNQVKIDGKWFQRKMISLIGQQFGARCSGCGILIAPKHYHHFGCPDEECPKCWRSLKVCNCKKEALKCGDVIKTIE